MGAIERIVTAPVRWVKSAVKWVADLDPDTKFMAAGGFTGGLAGGLGGYAAGLLEREQEIVITRTYPVPDLIQKHLGNIPEGFYEWGGSSISARSHPDQGAEPVYRDVPQYTSNGSVLMKDHTATLSSKSYGIAGGIVAGIAIGGLAGILAAAAALLARRLADSAPPSRTAP